MRIETERLLLRPLQAADAPAIARIWADSDFTRYMGGPRDFDKVRTSLEADALAEQPSQYDLWPVIEKTSGVIVGHCGLLDKIIDERTEVELVYVLAASTWSKGYATEIALALKDYAFTQLGLRRVVALIDPENTASEHVAIKVNMVFEKATIRPDAPRLCDRS
jgi:ribosomal-protein-alanine N-acetyltransferase